MAKRKKPCDVPSITGQKNRPGKSVGPERIINIGPSIDNSTSMSSVGVSLPLNTLVDVRLRAVSLLLLVM